MSYPIVNTFEEACDVVQHIGILPLSSFIPDHPSLASITLDDAWHTGLDTDPWLWRDRFAGEGVAAYGRFLASKPILISRQLFPLIHCVLSPTERVADRFAAGKLARSAIKIYECISENDDIDVKRLRILTGMHQAADKRAFDRSLANLRDVCSGRVRPCLLRAWKRPSSAAGFPGASHDWEPPGYLRVKTGRLSLRELHRRSFSGLKAPAAPARSGSAGSHASVPARHRHSGTGAPPPLLH